MLRRWTEPRAAAKRLFDRHMDAAQIWSDVCRLKIAAVPPAIACCEMAFARIAIMKFLCHRIHGQAAGSLVAAELDRLTASEFSGGDEETRDFYGAPLQQAARAAVEAYLRQARDPAQVGTLLVSRIECRRSPEILKIFAGFGNEVAASVGSLRLQPPSNRPHSIARALQPAEQLRHLVAE